MSTFTSIKEISFSLSLVIFFSDTLSMEVPEDIDYSAFEKCLLQSETLYQYILNTTAFPREHEQLKKIREETKAKFPKICVMNVPPEEGQLLAIILKAMNAKRIIEVGVFTGYSLQAAALALPEDAKISAIDISREYYEIDLPFIKEAGVGEKKESIKSDAVQALDKLVEEVKEGGELYDFSFVDAEKSKYWDYHERLLKLVRVGGLLCYDNTLWFGTVAHPLQPNHPGFINSIRESILNFNDKLSKDSRIELSQICIGDGLTICHRVS